jgi:hypothetical protein
MREEIADLLAPVTWDFGGGCSVSKALVLAWLIKYSGTQSSCDLGVYRGRSYFPQAWAHRSFTKGTVFGIDPYSRSAAKQNDKPEFRDALETWRHDTDFDKLHDEVVAFTENQGLDANSKLMRMTSAEAGEAFRRQSTSFGLIHIDGNHDTDPVVRDVTDFVPLLERDSFLVLDDISWESVKPAVEMVRRAGFVQLYEQVDDYNDYAVFWNGHSRVRTAHLQAALRWVNRAHRVHRKSAGSGDGPQVPVGLSGDGP